MLRFLYLLVHASIEDYAMHAFLCTGMWACRAPCRRATVAATATGGCRRRALPYRRANLHGFGWGRLLQHRRAVRGQPWSSTGGEPRARLRQADPWPGAVRATGHSGRNSSTNSNR